MNFIIPPSEETTVESKIPRKSVKTLKIPANLKDEKKLKKFYAAGEKLYNSKKYKDAEKLFKKLLKTGWQPGLINGMLGECRYQLKDIEGAEKYYKASLASGYTDKPEFALHSAKIKGVSENPSEVIKILEPFMKNENLPQEIYKLLAEAYSKTGNIKRAANCYQKLNPALLSEDQLTEYAEILEKQNNKEAAFKIYLMIGKIYNRNSAYIKAELLAPDEKTKMYLLAKIVGKTRNTPKGNYYKMQLGIKMIKAGKKNEGVEILKSVKTLNLKQTAATEYLMMLPFFKDQPVLRKESINILIKYYSDNLKINQKIRDLLINSGNRDMGEIFFKNMYLQNQTNPIAAYMYAGFQTKENIKQSLYTKAIALSPDFYQAKIALAKCLINQQNWKEALKIAANCEKQKPYAKEPKYYLTLAKINMTHSSMPLKRYEAFLKKIKTPEKDIRREMLLISEAMSVKQYALRYLEQAEKIPELKQFCIKEKLKIKLIYKTIKESDFTDTNDPQLRKFYIIYLMGKGQYSTIMNLSVKKENAPDFWKLLIRWKQDIPSWKQKSYKLLKKNSDNILISTVVKLWLKQITTYQAEQVVNSIDYIDRPLLIAIIAEQCRKNGKNLRAKILFYKAFTYPNPNIYTQMINYMRKH
jgi:predicted Zn-dependent protease